MKQFILFLLATIVISPMAFAQLSYEEETDPGVRSLLAANPQSMDEYMETAVLMGKLNRPDLTKHFLQKLLEKAPTDADWLHLNDLAQKISPAYLQEFVRVEPLQPTGKTVAEKIYVVLRKTYESDDAIKQSLKAFLDAQWGSEESHSAFDKLNRSGINGVLVLINALYANVQTVRAASKSGNAANIQEANSQGPLTEDQLQTVRRNSQMIRTALTKINLADEPLIACLDSEDPEFLREAISILGRRGAPTSTHYLLGFAAPKGNPIVSHTAELALNELKIHPLTNSEAATVLIQAAQRSLEGTDPAKGEFGGKASGWIWSEKEKTPQPITADEKVIRTLRAVRLARGAYRRMPENDSLRRYYWVSEAEYQACFPSEENNARLNQVLVDSVPTELRSARYRDYLDFAMRFQYDASAQKACELLGSLKDKSVLSTASERPAELICALAHPNPSVRWAAAEAIINIDPIQPYIGSCSLISTLKWFIQGNGEQKILIACPKMEDAMALANYLPAPYIGIPATTGKQALGILADESDFSAVLYSSDLYSVPAEVFLEKVRAIPSAAGLPVAIMAKQPDWVKIRNLTQTRKYSTWFPTPTSEEDMDRGLNLINSVRRYAPESEKLVQDRAMKAIEYAANLAEASYGEEYVTNQRLVPQKSESASSSESARNSNQEPVIENKQEDVANEENFGKNAMGNDETIQGSSFDEPEEVDTPENDKENLEVSASDNPQDDLNSNQSEQDSTDADSGDDPFVDNPTDDPSDEPVDSDDDPFSIFSEEANADNPQNVPSNQKNKESGDDQPNKDDSAQVNPFASEIISANKDLSEEEVKNLDLDSLPILTGPGQMETNDLSENVSTETSGVIPSPEEALPPNANPFESDEAESGEAEPADASAPAPAESTELPTLANPFEGDEAEPADASAPAPAESIELPTLANPAAADVPTDPKSTKSQSVPVASSVPATQTADHGQSPFVSEKRIRMRELYNLSTLIPVLRNRLMGDVNTKESLKALSCIPTCEAQYEIILYASSKLHTIDNRNLAISALDRSVSQFGLLMKSDQITRQYEISATEQDESSIEILNKVLDIIETPWLTQDKKNKSNIDRANEQYYPVKKLYHQWEPVLK